MYDILKIVSVGVALLGDPQINNWIFGAPRTAPPTTFEINIVLQISINFLSKTYGNNNYIKNGKRRYTEQKREKTSKEKNMRRETFKQRIIQIAN